MADNNEVPQYLYRGMCINYEELEKFQFTGIDMELPYQPYIDDQGRETVTDGNEYGIYMSDNPKMVTYAYGNPTNNGDGLYIEPKIVVGGRGDFIKVPDVGVVYKISTENLDVKKPWISNALQGVYNNGYNGDEWIAKKIPAQNYELMKVVIGKDILHDEENMPLDDIENLKQKTIEIMQQRKERLEVFAREMSKIPEERRKNFSLTDIDVCKKIYGKDGFKYMDNFEAIDTSTDIGMLKYLMAKVYDSNRENIDFRTLTKLQDLMDRVEISNKKGKSINIYELIKDEALIKFMEEKSKIVEEPENGTTPLTNYYEKYGIDKNEDWESIKSKLSKESRILMKRQSTTNDRVHLEEINENLNELDEALKMFNPKNEQKRQQYDRMLEHQINQQKQVVIMQHKENGTKSKPIISMQKVVRNAIEMGIATEDISQSNKAIKLERSIQEVERE